MPSLDNVSCGDDYTAAATLQDIWKSNGGGFAISDTGGDAYVQLQYGELGLAQWTNEQRVPAGSSGPLYKGTVGIQFRNAVAGQVAIVTTASLATQSEPPLTLQSGPGAAPAPAATTVVAIDNVTLTSISSLITFGNISQAYANLMLVGRVKTDATPGPTDMLRMQINSDSGAHYYWQQTYATGVTPAAAQGLADTALSLLPATTTGGGATGRFSPFELTIPFYNESGDYADGVCKWGSPVGTTSGSIYAGVTCIAWDQLEPIKQITLFPASGGHFIGGSRVTLYGMGTT